MSNDATAALTRKIPPRQAVYKRPAQAHAPHTVRSPMQRLAAVQSALAEADKKLEMAYDAAEVGQPIDLVLECLAHELMPDAVRPMRGDAPTAADAEATYDAMFLPLAFLESAIALSLGTIVHGTLVEAFLLLDWAHNECEGLALHRLMPEASPAAIPTPIEADPTVLAQEDDAEKERRQLAAACTLEIEKLAQATKTVCDFGDNYPVINGIMGRIAQLSEVIYLAMHLHGESDEEYEAYDHRAMEAFFEGRLP